MLMDRQSLSVSKIRRRTSSLMTRCSHNTVNASEKPMMENAYLLTILRANGPGFGVAQCECLHSGTVYSTFHGKTEIMQSPKIAYVGKHHPSLCYAIFYLVGYFTSDDTTSNVLILFNCQSRCADFIQTGPYTNAVSQIYVCLWQRMTERALRRLARLMMQLTMTTKDKNRNPTSSTATHIVKTGHVIVLPNSIDVLLCNRNPRLGAFLSCTTKCYFPPDPVCVGW
ncbi:hypothetical protein AHF37_06808 [Paragonimus kellicotti]|nr:hypothetical protein AHF37_06808 [Paragonimus kellicotti]